MPFIGTTPAQGFASIFNKQTFTANGSTTSFTLSHRVNNANDLEVFVGNVRQEPTEAYSASGLSLVMTQAPANGVSFYVIYKGLAQITTSPSDGSVGDAQIQNGSITAGKVNSSFAQTLGVPAGIILPYGSTSAPTGYLSCDGAAVSRSTYSTLFSAIGTTWGVGDNSSTFNVPDLRAMFLRGTGTHGTANMAKGTDFSAPAVGTIENDQMQDHKHQTIMSPGTSYQTYSSYAIGNNAYGTTYNFNTTAPQEINSQGTPRTGDETRPVNAAVLYVIKT
tara:strand:+ start:651 stop:1484 length:834 start_codon:yes stop_codon:yes gene_type:complete